MIAAIVFLSSALTNGQDAAPQSTAFVLADAIRLPMTPLMDGKIEDGEWDPASTSESLNSYLQWEPGILYFGSKSAMGQDVVWSLDLNGDGWLQGNDNVEIRISYQGGNPKVQLQMMDATDRNGPSWHPMPLLEGVVNAKVTESGESWSCEAKVLSSSFAEIKEGASFGLRADAIPTESPVSAAFQPRSTSMCLLRYDRSKNLPEGFTWRPQLLARTVAPGDEIKIKFVVTYAGMQQFMRATMKTAGLGEPFAAQTTVPFPPFDKKNRSTITYQSRVSENAPVGYRILNVQFEGPDNTTTTLQTSYYVSDIILFDVNLPKRVDQSPDSQVIRGSVRLRSQSTRRLDGDFSLITPQEFTVTSGRDKKFTIYQSRGSMRIPLEIVIPQNARGLIPLTFKAVLRDRVIEQTYFWPVGN